MFEPHCFLFLYWKKKKTGTLNVAEIISRRKKLMAQNEQGRK